MDLSFSMRWANQKREQRRAQGWNTLVDPAFPEEGIAIATLLADPTQVEGLGPADMNQWRSRLLLLLGGAFPPETFLSPPLEVCIRKMAASSPFLPSRQLLRWLVEQNVAVAFHHEDTLSRAGMALISPHRLPMQKFLEAGIVQQVRYADKAWMIWHIGGKEGPAYCQNTVAGCSANANASSMESV